MIAFVPCDIYCQTDTEEMALSNKLFCTFVEESQINYFVEEIKQRKQIPSYDLSKYNIVENNINYVPEHTIMVHRKKESNTLYTINALNELIKRLNDGVVDTNYRINWQHYKNTILLTQHDELKQLKTKIHKIVEL